jgi:hypothetical protein
MKVGTLVQVGRLPSRPAIVAFVVEPGPFGIYLVRWADTGELCVRDIPWHELKVL